jgi:hypothetical protein
MNSMLGEMFSRCGVEVHYSAEADNDDTIAAFAHHFNAALLSRDKDMFRYTNSRFAVFSEYNLSRGVLTLTPHPRGVPGTFRHPEPRPLPPTLPETRPHILHVKDGEYLRGAPSPFVRSIPNPHGVIAPLRHAAYARMGLPGPVREEWPEWDPAAGAVVWREDHAAAPSADPAAQALLDRPDAAVEAYFPVAAGAGCGRGGVDAAVGVPWREWEKHCFCVRSVVYEVCAMARAGAGAGLLDLWLEWAAGTW